MLSWLVSERVWSTPFTSSYCGRRSLAVGAIYCRPSTTGWHHQGTGNAARIHSSHFEVGKRRASGDSDG